MDSIEIQGMLKVLENHGVEAFAFHGEIHALDVATVNGEPVSKYVTLEPSLKAIKNWLGY